MTNLSSPLCLTSLGFGTFHPGVFSTFVSAVATRFARASLDHQTTIDGLEVRASTQGEIDAVRASMELLSAADPRRYRRLKRCVRSVLVSDWPASYSPYERTAYLTSVQPSADTRESTAMELVQLATHGWLFCVGHVAVTRSTLFMRERVCVREAVESFRRCLNELGLAPNMALRRAEDLRSKLLAEIDRSTIGREGRHIVRVSASKR